VEGAGIVMVIPRRSMQLSKSEGLRRRREDMILRTKKRSEMVQERCRLASSVTAELDNELPRRPFESVPGTERTTSTFSCRVPYVFDWRHYTRMSKRELG
jgi:hypothetical protein